MYQAAVCVIASDENIEKMAYLERSEVGARIFYQERGEGPAILLINGLSQSTANWMSQVSALSERYRVITFDSRGQGRSDVGNRPLTIDEHVDDIIALLDHLGIERVHPVGFSHGARIGLRLAAKRPNRVGRLVVTGMGADDGLFRRTLIRVWREVLRLGGVEALAWCSLTDILSQGFLELHADDIETMVQTTVKRNSTEGLAAMLDGLMNYPASLEDARLIQAPTLVCSADKDPLCSEQAADRLAIAIPNVRHVRFANCGHTIPIEQPRRWREEVLSFLDIARRQGE